MTHLPVLVERVTDLLAPALQAPDAIVVDATVGLGGHSAAILERFPDVHLVGLDRDPHALERAQVRLAQYGERVTLVHAVYDQLAEVCSERGITSVQGILFDLGVSSMQLDEMSRGFSYAHNSELDMRMDPTAGITAADVLNTYDAKSLTRILREFGEERFASRIAARIVREREREPFRTSDQLVDVVRACIPAPARRTGGNPAKRTFQALRIEVNGELESLKYALPSALGVLAEHGRIVVLSYQSLEDRLVKQAFAAGAHPPVPHGLPIIPADRQPWLRLLTRGAEKATEAEIEQNPRSAPARLRAAERLVAA